MNRARPLWPGDRNGHAVVMDLVPRKELLQGVGDELRRVGVGLRENLRILDVVEGLDGDLVGVVVPAGSALP